MSRFFVRVLVAFWAAGAARAADPGPPGVNLEQSQKPPHPVERIFYLSELGGKTEAAAIVGAVKALKTVTAASVNLVRGYALVAFDQRDLSYHEVAQAIADAGAPFGKHYDPRVVIYIPDYPKPAITPKVKAVLDDAKLKPLIRLEAIDESKGIFFVHFLPLKRDPALVGWQGFNGGALTHPIHMAPPVGLSLDFSYASEDDPAIPVYSRAGPW